MEEIDMPLFGQKWIMCENPPDSGMRPHIYEYNSRCCPCCGAKTSVLFPTITGPHSISKNLDELMKRRSDLIFWRQKVR